MSRRNGKTTIRTEDLLRLRAHAGSLDLALARRASSVLVGGRRSAFRGRGMDFEESRPYEPTDDVRSIDWRVTARRGEPHTKVFTPERERPVVILVDVGSNMAFGSQGRLKSVLAAQVGALIAWMAVSKGDRIGAFIFSDRAHQEIRPTSQVSSTIQIFKAMERLQAHPDDRLAHLSNARPDSRPGPPGGGVEYPGALDDALARVAHTARPGTLVFILADYWRLSEAGERHFSHCTRHCEVVCGYVYDPWEQNLPGTEDYRFTNGRISLVLHADDRKVRAAYRQRYDDHLSRLQTLCNRSAAHFLTMCTNTEPVAALGGGLAVPSPG